MFKRSTRASSRVAIVAALMTVGTSLPAAGQAASYPSRPQPLPEAEEIALAMSAAPPEVATGATIYVLRASGPAIARVGTNGCTCMVGRDLHQGSLYPICYDQVASRSALQQELMELRLRFEGKSETEVITAVAAAYAAGTLKAPSRGAVIYMMSRRQVLFSSPLVEGVRVGAWHPHLMIAMPYVTGEQLGFGQSASLGDFQIDHSGEPGAQLIVPVQKWSDASSAAGAP
jgi:hypothetical protein